MSKAKESKQAALVEVPPPPPAPVPAVPVAAAPQERLAEVDRMALELAKSKRQTALAEAKTALANNDNAELSYKYVVLQIYMKYGLTEADAITEAGEVLRGGAVQQLQGK